jgi:vancomycin resistance protein YoaR
VLPAIAVLGAVALALGLAFAGAPDRIASGVRISGVDVGGLTAAQAGRLLERRARGLRRVPVRFTAGSRSWRLTPEHLGVRVDWSAAARAALDQGSGLGPFRGLRRIDVRLFGTDVAPPVEVYRPALAYELKRMAASLDVRRREAAVELHGLRPVVVPGRSGSLLDRGAAAAVVVRALAGLSRRPVALPVRKVTPTVRPADLAPAAAQARTALAAPVRLALGPTRWRLSRRTVSTLLALPRDGSTTLAVGGPGAATFFRKLGARVDRRPEDADWDVSRARVRVIPDRPGRKIDVERSSRRLLAAALSPPLGERRLARLAVTTSPAQRTTAEAEALGIVGRVAAYTTYYGGDPNRIHNVQLVSHLIDHHLIAPGATFSFNGTTGERSASKGFREAPVIINGELQTGLGGGVCQVSTTVFNAAFEAGLPITQRTNHALYISHYPLGRDATVNYPDVDLKFVNDTGGWLLLRAFVGSSSLTVGLYGTPVHRRVESSASPLVTTGRPPVERIRDPALETGTTVLEDPGEPSRATSVHRLVYKADGTLLYDDTWRSSYRSEPRIVRVGTKPKPEPKPAKPRHPEQPGGAATTTTPSPVPPR